MKNFLLTIYLEVNSIPQLLHMVGSREQLLEPIQLFDTMPDKLKFKSGYKYDIKEISQQDKEAFISIFGQDKLGFENLQKIIKVMQQQM